MYDFSVIKDNYKNTHSEWHKYPIVLSWIDRGTMDEELLIIKNKVLKLLEKNAKLKIREWLYSSDSGLTDITAERYLIDYLTSINTNITENLFGSSTDATILYNGVNIGIEVTTIKKTYHSWIFIERLLGYLKYKKYQLSEKITITSPILTLSESELIKLIENIGEAIISNKTTISTPIKIEREKSASHYINWEIKDPNYEISYLVNNVSNIYKNKEKQLRKNKKNLLFIGVNQLPVNSIFPEIFDIKYKLSHEDQINYLEELIIKSMPDNVIGICFFTYDLRQEHPYYPLKIIWKDSLTKIDINI